jgi:cyclophilin family peptidyl-prolyl cis-trans isomerase
MRRVSSHSVLYSKTIYNIFNVLNFFSKHVVFGHVVSGQTLVDTIENLPVEPTTNRPLKDVVISRCGELEIVISKLITLSKKKEKNMFIF